MIEIICRTGDVCLDEAVAAVVRRTVESFLPLLPDQLPYRRLILAPSHEEAEEGDLYLPFTHPFSIRETEAGVRQLFRGVLQSLEGKSGAVLAEPSPTADSGEQGLFFDGISVRLGDRAVSLTPKEAAVFRILYDAWGSPVSREALTQAVWGGGSSTNVCDVTVCHLRSRLEPIFGKGAIVNIRGEGYLLLQT